MLLTPRYDGPPIMTMDGAPGCVGEALIRQRRRLADELATLSDEQWQHPSRCEGWTGQDVVSHLIGTNGFWHASVVAGLAGSPTRVLAGFDPATTPPLMVEPMRSLTPREVLDQLTETNEALLSAIEALDATSWSTTAESPPGHVPIDLLAHHALWDSWVHERDVLLPLGITPPEEADEVVACLRYAAALGPSLLATTETGGGGVFAIEATDPVVHIVVEVGTTVAVRDEPAPTGAPTLTGQSVDLVEALSIRAPIHASVPAGWQALFGRLALVFDTEVEFA
jgi:uncharacterized protein (TIGR03083 family)